MKDFSFFSSLKTPLEKRDSTCFTPLQGSPLHYSAQVTLFTPSFAFFSPVYVYFWYHVTKAWGKWFILFCKQTLWRTCSGSYRFSKLWNTSLIWKTLHSDDRLILWLLMSEEEQYYWAIRTSNKFLPQTSSATNSRTKLGLGWTWKKQWG